MANDITGCNVQLNETTCSSCISGYYLDKNNACIANPYGSITNCDVYNNSPDSCYSCKNNFMRIGTAEPYLCTAVTPITNCIAYNGSVTTTTCTQCQTGFYVSSNACVARKYSTISQCSVYNPIDDSCQTCSSNYQLITNSTGNSCVALGSNCLALDATAGAFCKTCSDGFMPTSGSVSCITGSITNCRSY